MNNPLLNAMTEEFNISQKNDSIKEVVLNVSANKISYHLVLNRKLTIVSDDSYTGKTHLYNLVKAKHTRVTVECEYLVKSVDTVEAIDITTPTQVILIDESAECITDTLEEFQRRVVQSNHIFVIFSRDICFTELAYGVDSLKKFIKSNGVRMLTDKYDKDKLLPMNIPHIDNCYIEDSTTGLRFFENIFPTVKSTFGKHNYKMIFNQAGNTLFIFDLCGFGDKIDSFYNIFYKIIQYLHTTV